MTLPTYGTAFVDNNSTIPADFLNSYVRTQIPKAIDGVGGGSYSPSVLINIGGTAGLKISCTGSAARLQYGSRSITRAQTGLIYNLTAGTWSPGEHTIGASETGIQVLDRIPNGATITGFSLYHDRVGGGVLPTTRVTVALRKKNVTTGVGSAFYGPTEDPESVQASYNALHEITATSLSEVVNNTTTVYYLDFQGEVGGATSSTVMYPIRITYTITDQDEAP